MSSTNITYQQWSSDFSALILST